MQKRLHEKSHQIEPQNALITQHNRHTRDSEIRLLAWRPNSSQISEIENADFFA